MNLRDHRTGRSTSRKGTSELVRTSQKHRDRKQYQREQQQHQQLLDEWAEDYAGEYDIWGGA